jgi:hypothetical protein
VGIGIDVKTNLIVKELDYNDELKKQLEQFKQTQTHKTIKSKKPWWKI